MALLSDPTFWAALFGVTLIQIALGADNLIIITIIANKLPGSQRKKAIQLGLILAMAFRVVLLAGVTVLLNWATATLFTVDGGGIPGLEIIADVNGTSLILLVGSIFLLWKGIHELRVKLVKKEEEVSEASSLRDVVMVIVGMNLLFSVDSILTVVGMTDIFSVMVGSVVISVALMLIFAGPISDFLAKNPEFEILGLFVLLLIGFVLFLEAGHTAQLEVNGSPFPYIPQWIVIFMLLMMFCVDLYQNWWERAREKEPVELRHRKK